MTDIKIETFNTPQTGVYIDIINKFESNPVSIIQDKLQVRLNVVKGEWSLDSDAGVPLPIIFQNSDSPDVVAQYYADEALKVPGVLSITIEGEEFDSVTKSFSAKLVALTSDGQITTVGV
jgi:hypothetical protein